MTARFPTAPRRLSGHDLGEIPFAAGSFDVVEYRPRGVVLFGWMLMPDGAFDDIEVFWNSQQAGSAPQGPRADVGAALAWAAGAADSGFLIELDDLELGSPGRIDLLGHREGGPAARLSTLVWPPSEDSAPLPPPELADRVSQTSGAQFRNGGLKGFTDLLEQIDEHTERSEIGTVLDWGCGCGRFTRLLISAGFSRVLGCDIDSEAVAWCRGNLAGAEFTHIGTDPPAPYPDASVDLVIACSVFTHLASADQAAWLRELHRVTAPGALVLASVHGDYAFRLDQGWGRPAGRLAAARARLRRRGRSATLKRRGWLDSGEDPSLGEAAPKGYYRTVYQTRRHTIDSWGRQFEIVDYVERGLNGHQDLVVMRRR